MGSETSGLLNLVFAWGPMVIAGMLLAVVLVALSTGKLTAARESLLKVFFYGGVVCFLVALIAPMMFERERQSVRLSIEAGDINSDLPLPDITLNGAPFGDNGEFVPSGEAEIIVDVRSAALRQAAISDHAAAADAEVMTLSRELEGAEAALEEKTAAFEEIVSRTAALAEEIAALRLEIENAPANAPVEDAPAQSEAPAQVDAPARAAAASTRARPVSTRSPAERLDEAERELRDVETFGTGIFR